MGKLVQVKLGEYRQAHFSDLNGIKCERDDYVVLDGERGSEFGRVMTDRESTCAGKTEQAKSKVLRLCTEGDLKQIANNRIKAKEAVGVCSRKISDRKLDMQLVKAEYVFDNSKIIFYFTADGRVDFRNLVKDLARVFRVRIELKQIGVRDKAKIVGGHGVCGRELCCSSHMSSFHQLSIKMAKEQGLPLNPSRISGVCGRIKCCMAYEFDVYKQFNKNLPRMGETVSTPEGKGKVVELNILKKYVNVDVGEGKVVRKDYVFNT
ncbi:MAG: cell fate regulator YaaT (PSP1 superfamily) [Candidatus Omnitrophota bacterium]|jgi:cell fate regulator YaaT (PSP1 superfamily)